MIMDFYDKPMWVIEIEDKKLTGLLYGLGSIAVGIVCMFIGALKLIGPFFIGFGLGYIATVIRKLKFKKE
jgi:uncharacterized membrane protein (Fun14 family)